VAPESVAASIQHANVSVSLSRPTTYNVRVTLPNKLFEAIAAGLPVVATDTFALRRIIHQYGLGILCTPLEPQAIAAAIQSVLSPAAQEHYRANTRAAQATLNWQTEAEKLCKLYETILTLPY
jgi:glycosyltransferase involved in cell wall biosynthesis